MKHMTETAIEVLGAVYPVQLTERAIERLAELAGVDLGSRNVGGWWTESLIRAGLVEYTYQPTIGDQWALHYKLTEDGWGLYACGRGWRMDV